MARPRVSTNEGPGLFVRCACRWRTKLLFSQCELLLHGEILTDNQGFQLVPFPLIVMHMQPIRQKLLASTRSLIKPEKNRSIKTSDDSKQAIKVTNAIRAARLGVLS